MKIWKKNLIAGAVLLCVCAGIYVNWLYTQEQTAVSLTDTLDEGKLLADDTLVMADGTDAEKKEQQVSDYFAAVRLSRQEARDNALTLLQEAMAYSEESTQANGQLEDIVQTALCEAQIESLVLAKGYAECVAYMSSDGISVAVASPEGGLKQEDVAVIADIVITQSGVDFEDIRVVEVP